MKIVVDAMGGDNAPQAIVAGVIDAIKKFDVNIALIGLEKDIKDELSKFKYPKNRIEVIHAPDVIGMHDPAISSLRQKKNSSITRGVSLLKEEDYDAFISAGNTGAVVAASTIKLGMLDGVERPAIGLVIPTLKNFAFLIDVGANTEAKPQHLLQSALMANVYSHEVLGIKTPEIGMLNIGEESSKGGGFAKETYKLLEKRLTNFIGNVEANEIYSGKADCIICDGFVGNVVIKTSQGLMESAGALLKREIKKSPLALLGAMIMKPCLNHIKKLADYSEYGGAPLLGVNGVVMISHGRSSPKAIKNAIRATMQEVKHNILQIMTKEISGDE
ncbi:Phosphate:acyl-ACP acyltransferase PlsX (EC 2.3.1.n2) [hydrothermal vent metagenome]|uniref:phosphate acyltransferase n=1 Tax=hydrothermal vent metagenome TaxID=652676 RepID=A0A3B1DPF6_9ZZZZ